MSVITAITARYFTHHSVTSVFHRWPLDDAARDTALHEWLVGVPWGVIQLKISDRNTIAGVSAEIELHSRFRYTGEHYPNCPILRGPCWHDGSSLIAQERYLPMWRDGASNDQIFAALVDDFETYFDHLRDARGSKQ